MAELSILIVSYNVKGLLSNCIRSLYASTYKDFEIIVADNNSADGSADEVERLFPGVKLIRNTSNKGFSAGNNQALSAASGEYIFLLNPDTEVQENTLQQLMDFAAQTKDAGVIAPMLLNTDGTYQASSFNFYTLGSELGETFFINYIKDLHTPFPAGEAGLIHEVDAVSGAAMLMSRQVMESAGGGLDEELFWSEDMDLCFRIRRLGLKVYYYPQAVLTHHLSKSARQDYRIPISNQVLSRLKFFRKNKSVPEWLAVVMLSYVHVISRGLLFAVLAAGKRTALLKLKAYVFTFGKLTRYLVRSDRSVITR